MTINGGDTPIYGHINGDPVISYQIIVGANGLGYHWFIKYWTTGDSEARMVNGVIQRQQRDQSITSIDMAYGLAENAWKKLLDKEEDVPTKVVVTDGPPENPSGD